MFITANELRLCLPEIAGIVNGYIILTTRSEVFLTGIVTGGIYNDGGMIEIYGIVTNRILEDFGETIIHPGSIINDIKY